MQSQEIKLRQQMAALSNKETKLNKRKSDLKIKMDSLSEKISKVESIEHELKQV